MNYYDQVHVKRTKIWCRGCGKEVVQDICVNGKSMDGFDPAQMPFAEPFRLVEFLSDVTDSCESCPPAPVSVSPVKGSVAHFFEPLRILVQRFKNWRNKC